MDGLPNASPSMTPPMGSSPMGAHSASPGAAAQSMAQVREAIQLLQKALPGLPVGTEIHQKVVKNITDLSKMVPASATNPQVQMTELRDLQQDAGQNQMVNAVQRSMVGAQPQGGEAPPQPGAM